MNIYFIKYFIEEKINFKKQKLNTQNNCYIILCQVLLDRYLSDFIYE